MAASVGTKPSTPEHEDLPVRAESSWVNAEFADAGLVECMQRIKAADFIAFDEAFLELIGPGAKLELIQPFEGEDANQVHEAPVYVPQTNELVFADTSVVGWLWALDVETHTVRGHVSHA